MQQIALPASTGLVLQNQGAYYAGISVRNTSGSNPASVDVYDSTQTHLYASVGMVANGSASEVILTQDRLSPAATNGFLVVISGTVTGTLRYSTT